MIGSPSMHPLTAYAPGRAELLGNHTDYNEGYVLAIAVDRGTTITGMRRTDGVIRLHSREFEQTEEIALGEITSARDRIAPWSRYVLGVVDQFRRTGLPTGGFEAEITGNLPLGAGLSSSASLENATTLFLMRAFGTKIEPLEIARIGQKTENEFVGVQCGLLDQIASLMGQSGKATLIDFRTFAVGHVPLNEKVRFVIANSGVKHSHVDSEYNTRRVDCEAAARILGVTALRDASTAMLEARKEELGERVYRRALHITGENERVLAGAEALRGGDLARFGELMFTSHESSRVLFENSCPELDLLVATAQKTPGVYGARLSGGGFGGSTINLVEAGSEEEVVKALTAALPGVSCLVTEAAGGSAFTLT